MREYNLILASGSPRRRELLERVGLRFTVRVSEADESLEPGLTPEEQVMRLSRIKAEAVAQTAPAGSVILAADTIVVLEKKILGKPVDPEDAAAMLRALSGRAHQVITGVTVLSPAGCETRAEVTEVYFRPLSPGEIDSYVATGEPMDKAGAYGIQGYAALFAQKLEGDYYNVMGLPLCLVGQMLRRAGIPILEETV